MLANDFEENQLQMNALNGFQPQFNANPVFSLGANTGANNFPGAGLGFGDAVGGVAGNFGPLGSMDALQMMLAQMLNGQFPGFQDPSMMQNFGLSTGFNPAMGFDGGAGGGIPSYGGGTPSYGGGGGGGGSSPSYSVGGSNGSSPSYGTNQSYSSGATSNAGATQASGTSGAAGTGQRAVDIARGYIGQASRNVDMPNYNAPGGNTNNCAAFVTGALKTAGKIDWTEAGVSNGNLREHLLADGWREIPGTEAKPGDVKISSSGGHTELVSEAGGTKTIGSNNVRTGYQEISERDNDPTKGTYYTKDEEEVTEAKDAAAAAEAKAADPNATAEDKAKAESAKADVKSAEAKADTKASEAKAADAKSADAKSADAKSESSSTSSGDKSKSSDSSSGGSSSSGSASKSSGDSGSKSSGGSSSASSGSSSGSSKGGSSGGSSSGGSSGGSSKA